MSSTQVWWYRSKEILTLFRFKSFDTDTAEGRSRERYRRILLTGLASALAKGVTVFTTLISVPLTLNYLGLERYGLWLVISSFTALLGFADFGLGNGLLNAISTANGLDDRTKAREYVSSSFFMLTTISMVLSLVFVVVYPWLDWQSIFNVTSLLAISETGPAMLVFMVCLLINIPLGIVQRIQLGYQQGFANSLWQALGGIIALISVLVAIHLKASLPWLVLSLVGAPVLAILLQSVVLFAFTHRWLRPHWKYVTKPAAKEILRLGFLFFVLQIAVALAYASDNLIATQLLGPEAIAQYAVPMRLFSIPTLLLSMFLLPLWSAYGEAIARNDIAWVKRMLNRSVGVALLIAGFPSAAMVVWGSLVISVWVGSSVQPSLLLLLGLGVWTVLSAVGNALAMFLNGANVIKFQVIFAIIMSIASLLAKIVLTPIMGVSGIVWGMILSYVVFTVIPIALYLPKLLSRMQQSAV